MSTDGQPGRVRSAWSELGIVGRLAFGGVAISGVIAVGLGFLLPAAVRDHVIAARLS